MAKQVRILTILTQTDKLLIAAAMLNVGVKARIKTLRIGFRVVFDGSRDVVAGALNNEGYLTAAGDAFGPNSFNGSNEVFVRYATH